MRTPCCLGLACGVLVAALAVGNPFLQKPVPPTTAVPRGELPALVHAVQPAAGNAVSVTVSAPGSVAVNAADLVRSALVGPPVPLGETSPAVASDDLTWPGRWLPPIDALPAAHVGIAGNEIDRPKDDEPPR